MYTFFFYSENGELIFSQQFYYREEALAKAHMWARRLKGNYWEESYEKIGGWDVI